MSSLVSFPMNADLAVRRVTKELMAAGLRVNSSFDLQSAREALADPDGCPCPYHGTARCSCQYIVLLVSPEDSEPVALELHGHDEETHLTLIETAGIPQNEETVGLVKTALANLEAAASVGP